MEDKKDGKSIYGRKVFFLYPNYSFQSDIMERLRTMEYEVYIINDYKNAKNILRKNPDSIFFVNVDNLFNTPSWIKYLQSIEEDETYKEVDIGVISDKADKESLSRYENELKHTAGIYKLSNDADEDLRTIVKTLDKIEAKGIRQYVRANCLDDSSAELFWLSNNLMYKLKIIDISAVGIAVRIPVRQSAGLKPGMLLPQINLMLKARPMPINATIYAIKPGDIFNTAIFMIANDTDKNALATIRTYVAETLQRKIEDQIFGMTPDRDEYNVSDKHTKSK